MHTRCRTRPFPALPPVNALLLLLALLRRDEAILDSLLLRHDEGLERPTQALGGVRKGKLGV